MAKAYVEVTSDVTPELLAVLNTYPDMEIEFEIPADFENGKDGAWL